MIGPEVPPHLLVRRHSEGGDVEQIESDSIGPQIPSQFLQKFTSPPFEDEDEPADEEDTAGPTPNSVQDVSRSSNISKVSSPGPTTSRRPVGPTLPPHLSQSHIVYDEDEDSDDEIGPRPPPAGVHQEEEDGVKRFMEAEEKRRKMIEEAAKPKAPKREEWMLKPPTSSELLGSLDPTRLKGPRQFSRSTTSSGVGVSSLWTETPAEKQQRLVDEVIGKRRRAVDPEPELEDDEKKKKKKDEEHIKRGVEEYTARVRGPSLLVQHTVASEKEEKDDKSVIWDHERDMAIGGRLMDDGKRNQFIKEARGLGDRFSSGKSGGFL
ncbi:hypothetical protein AX15_004865 [Amanita polypyramis BW_CC]|nr:hypothetical protein AX15_004865 [Amanita polypyramis BW_CC]